MKLFFVVSFFLLLSGVSNGQSLENYKGQKAEDLLMRSWNSPSSSEKASIRYFLSENFPNTAEGLFCKAWIEANGGNAKKSLDLYEECMEQFPKFAAAYFNKAYQYSLEKNYKAQVEVYHQLLDINSSFGGHKAIQYCYLTTLRHIGKSEADTFLKKWKKKLGNDFFIFHKIDGIVAGDNKDYQLSVESYKKVHESNKKEIDSWKYLMNAQMDKLFDHNRGSLLDKLQLLSPLMEYAESLENSLSLEDKFFVLQAYTYIAKKYYKYKYYRDASRVYRAAFKVYPTGELVEEIIKCKRKVELKYREDDVLNFLKKANNELPDNHLVEAELAWAYLTNGDLEMAEKYYEQAIKHSYTLNSKWARTEEYCRTFLQSVKFDYSQPNKLISEFIDNGYSDQAEVADALYENYLLKGELATAKKHLLEAERIRSNAKEISREYYNAKKAILKRLETNLTNEKSFAAKSSLEKKWAKKYGLGPSYDISFDENYTISAKEKSKFEAIAKLILEGDYIEYSFVVTAHLDKKDENNIISTKQAQAVVNYLVKNFSIPRQQLITMGCGNRYENSAGNKSNRIDLWLGAKNKLQPDLLVSGSLGTPYNSYGSELYKVKSGSNNFDFWDLSKKTKVKRTSSSLDVTKDFSLMGYPITSPNGRHEAEIAYYEHSEGNNYYSQYVLMIWDKVTGISKNMILRDQYNNVHWANNEEIIMHGGGNYLTRVDVVELKQKETIKTKMTKSVLLKSKDRLVGIRRAGTDDNVYVYEASTFKLLNVYTQTTWPHHIAASDDDRYVVAVDDRGTLHAWDTDNGWTYNSLRLSNTTQSIDFIPNSHKLVYDPWTARKPLNSYLIDIKEMSVLGRGDYEDIGFMSPSSSEKNGVFAYNYHVDKLQILNANDLSKVDELKGNAPIKDKSFALTDKKRLITIDSEGIHVWDMISGEKNHS